MIDLKTIYSRYAYYILIAIILLVSIYHFINILAYNYLNTDGGYYLSIARDISDGDVLYKNIPSPYTPLVMFLYSIIIKTGLSDYNYLLIFTYLFVFLSSLVLYYILLHFTKSKRISLVSSIMNLSIMFLYEANYIALEQFCIFFMLLAILLLIKYQKNNDKWTIYFAGVSIFLSFMSKQYGLFILPAVILFLFMSKISNIHFFQSILILLFGFVSGLIVFFGYYLVIHNVTPNDLARILLNIDKGPLADVKDTGLNYNWYDLIIRVALYIKEGAAFIVLAPILLIRNWKKYNKNIWFMLVALISSLTILKFAYYRHYFILIIPFVIILGSYLYSYNDTKEKKSLFRSLVKIFFILTILLSLRYVFKQSLEMPGIYKSTKIEQLRLAKEINEVVPPKSKVYVSRCFTMWYLCDLRSINEEIGYSFKLTYKPEVILRYMPKNGYLILMNDYKERYQQVLSQLSFVKIIDTFKGNKILIYKKE